ncbi:MAG: bifunctional folylpolyglutamate synthase/dihydrofolate synthase [Ignavibacteria bacterium]|nr:bifunctional folylpolyglutamate synthase/dihydrofolate synthase [Ignavibacteria bacterium]
MSAYPETLAWLYGLQKFGIKLGLENIRGLLESCGNPQRAYPTVHVAGTNGKGSTAAFIASILTESGCRTGLYTSPHLTDFHERIRVDGVPISQDAIVRYSEELRDEADARKATFFEATTCMALRQFADEHVDVAVIETGLGGRLDSTNVIEPRVTVITSVGMEHTDLLGCTLAEIAGEKAGIIKDGIPVVSGVTQREARVVIARAASERNAHLHEVFIDARQTVSHDIDATEFPAVWRGMSIMLVAPLAGAFQAENAALAVRAAELLSEHAVDRITLQSVIAGLAKVRKNTGLSARMERLQVVPELVVDVAHNPDGVRALLASWTAVRRPGSTHLVFGLLKSKDAAAVIDEVKSRAWASVTAVSAPPPEGRSAAELRVVAERAGMRIRTSETVHGAVDRLQSGCAPGQSILLFGSHYVVGEYLAERKKRTAINLDL